MAKKPVQGRPMASGTQAAKAAPVIREATWEPLALTARNATAMKRGNTVVIVIPDIEAHQYDGPKAPVYGMVNGKLGGSRDQRINLSIIGKSYSEGEHKIGGGVAENVKALRIDGMASAKPEALAAGQKLAKASGVADVTSLLKALGL